MAKLSWEENITHELEQAQSARRANQEGKARVCARRAAGLAIAEYLQRDQLPDPGPSAMDRLKYLEGLPDISPATIRAAQQLRQRVNANFELPANIDLIQAAHDLINDLLPEYREAAGRPSQTDTKTHI